MFYRIGTSCEPSLRVRDMVSLSVIILEFQFSEHQFYCFPGFIQKRQIKFQLQYMRASILFTTITLAPLHLVVFPTFRHNVVYYVTRAIQRELLLKTLDKYPYTSFYEG